MTLVLLAFVLVIAAACSSPEPPSDSAEPAGTTTVPAPRSGGSLTVGVGADADGFSPMASRWSGSTTQMARAILDPLVVMDRDGNWQPYLAEAITPDADFTTWTIELRPGITFHDGEPLDAAALASFLEAVTTSPLSSQGFPEKPQIEVTGDLSVTVTFTKPWAQMPTVLAEQPGYVIAPAQIQSGDTEHPIGTGPFVFDSWVKGDHLRATRNPNYWRDGLPYLDTIEFRPIADLSARKNALDSGDVDVIELPSSGQTTYDELTAKGHLVVDDVDNVGVMNLLMNTERGALADPDIRRAIVAGIDREAFRDTVLDDSFEIADQPYPAASRWHVDVDYPDFDPDRARQVVADYEAEHGPISITVITVAGGPTTAPEFIQQQLGQIGIDVALDPADLARFIQQFVTGNFDATYMGQFLSAADPDGTYPFLIGANAAPEALLKLNFTRYRNPDVDAALDAQRTTDDEATRKRELTTIWDALATDVPYAFLAYDHFALATTDDVHGLEGFATPEGVALPAINHWTAFYTAAFRS